MSTSAVSVRSIDHDNEVIVVDPTTVDRRLLLRERISLRLAVWLLIHGAHLAAQASQTDRDALSRRRRNTQELERRERSALRATVYGGHLH